MDIELKEYMDERFSGLEKTFQLMMEPLRSQQARISEDVYSFAEKHHDHENRLTIQEEFKEGHQRFHRDANTTRRFYWEIIISAVAIIAAIIFGG